MESAIANARLLMIYFFLIQLTGCASWEGKFSGTKEANIGVFADQTIAIIANSNLGLPIGNTVYVREFIEQSDPEVQEFLKLEKELDRRLLRLIQYSITLVDIAEASKSEKEKVEKYASFLKSIQKSAEENAGLAPGYYDNIIENIKEKKKFYEALQAAQPIINASGRGYQELLSNIEDSLKVLEVSLDHKIDERYATVIKYQQALEDEKYTILIALGQLYKFYKGDAEAFDKLRLSGALRQEGLLPKGTPSEKDLSNISDHLVKRLDITHKIWLEIEPDWKLYRATHQELDELYVKMKTSLDRTRATVIIWARTHQKMAAGITNPAEWFDINSAPAQLFKLGSNAIF